MHKRSSDETPLGGKREVEYGQPFKAAHIQGSPNR